MSPVHDEGVGVLKVLHLESLPHVAAEWRSEGAVVVLAHGCWDLLHIGHIQHLQAAKALGNYLVVTVTADEHVNKGAGRPRFPEHLRADTVAALHCVDAVAINRHPTAEMVIALLRPHVYVKGTEYREQKTAAVLAEEAAVRSYGGRMEFVTGDVIYSSTELLAGA